MTDFFSDYWTQGSRYRSPLSKKFELAEDFWRKLGNRLMQFPTTGSSRKVHSYPCGECLRKMAIENLIWPTKGCPQFWVSLESWNMRNVFYRMIHISTIIICHLLYYYINEAVTIAGIKQKCYCLIHWAIIAISKLISVFEIGRRLCAKLLQLVRLSEARAGGTTWITGREKMFKVHLNGQLSFRHQLSAPPFLHLNEVKPSNFL